MRMSPSCTLYLFVSVILLPVQAVAQSGTQDNNFKSIVNKYDTRQPSSYPAIGRIVLPPNSNPTKICTGFIISSGAILTAGHCFRDTPREIQFNVPLSKPDGEPVDPTDPDDQYQLSLISRQDSGVGKDWAIAKADPKNGQTPGLRQKAFFRASDIAHFTMPLTGRLSGYGSDGPPPDFGGSIYAPRNEYNKTQQTANGTIQGTSTSKTLQNTLCYVIDSQGGNSGSPVTANGTEYTLAIHIKGDGSPCDISSSTIVNKGTTFQNTDLVKAMHNFPGELQPKTYTSDQIVFADSGAFSGTSDGTVLKPFKNFEDLLDNVMAKSQKHPMLISAVAGNYQMRSKITFKIGSSGIILTMPVGDIRLYMQDF